jgi:type IV pilus assembly protein PilC
MTMPPTTRKTEFSFQHISANDKLFFFQHLEILVRTGFSLGTALKALAKQTTNKKMRMILEDLEEQLQQGATLTSGLERHPKVFSKLMTTMIHAGEISGNLDQILKQLSIQLKKDHTLRKKVQSAMIYPSVILSAMIIIGTLMFIFVIPSMLSIYEDFEGTLPLMTRLLIAITNLLVHQGWIVGSLLLLLLFLGSRVIRTPSGKRLFHRFILHLPIFGTIVRKINLARFSQMLHSLMTTDIPIDQSLVVTGNTLRNVIYRDALIATSEGVKQGATIASLLEREPKLFPPVVTQMFAVGEQSGTLETITEEVANFYDEEVDQITSGLTAIIEPILILLLGGAVAFIASALILPMYSLVDQV